MTPAPVRASALAVSTPMPEDAPVTMARRPERSMPATTSAAVDWCPNGVVTRGMIASAWERSRDEDSGGVANGGDVLGEGRSGDRHHAA